mgnify:CR=1 FL=1
MAVNKIQIKRSVANGVVSGLANGELAFTQASNTLWIGLPDGSGVVSIAGARTPGTLTANQALVANSTSGIDKIIVGNATITTLYANGSQGTSGQVLVSNGTSVFWGTGTSGTNTQVQFNDSGVANGSSNFTFDKASNELKVGNSVSTAYLTALNGARNITTNYGSVGGAVGVATDLTVGASGSGGNVSIPSTATLKIGTTTVNSTYFTGTANNADYLGGWGIANIQTWISTNASAAYTNATSYTDTKIATANLAITGNAATAYTNAVSYVDTKIGTANAAITGNAATAYTNAMADTLSRNGSYTGNNTFGGTSTTFNSNVAVNARITTDLMPSANVTYNVGNNTVRWNEIHASNVHSVSAYFDGNVQVGGNLLVSGNVTTVNVTSVIVSDPLIYLAGNNYTSDLVDIGFAGNYNDGTNRHTGLIRHASSDQYYLFKNLTQELSGNNVVDINDATFRLADLNAWIQSGALTSNSTAVRITANSTVSAQFVANSLTLTTALAATSGGTGYNTYTSGDILVANTGNALSVLSLGTAGYLLQSNGSALVYAGLDGGTF